MQFLYLDKCIRLSLILQHLYYDVTMKTYRFVNAHLTALDKGEYSLQNSIALEFYLIFAIKAVYMH